MVAGAWVTTAGVKAKSVQTLVFVVLLILLAALLIFGAGRLPHPMLWMATGLIFVGLFVVIGSAIAERWDGILIDSTGMNLARFQLVVWTAVFLSAWTAAVFINLASGAADPLAIRIPEELWVLLGISTTSLVGSPIVQSGRKAVNALRDKSRADASWTDLFLGEEKGNQSTVDVANLQMFFFTIVIVFAYLIALLKTFTTTVGGIAEFPAVSESMVALLGISHAGFLANKPIPKDDPETLQKRERLRYLRARGLAALTVAELEEWRRLSRDLGELPPPA